MQPYYLYLALAISGELIGTTALKYSAGFTRLFPAALTVVAYVACFFFFSKALNGIALNVAYATWSGVGIIAATLLSCFLFRESINFVSVLGIVLIVTGVVLLNLFGAAH